MSVRRMKVNLSCVLLLKCEHHDEPSLQRRFRLQLFISQLICLRFGLRRIVLPFVHSIPLETYCIHSIVIQNLECTLLKANQQ